MNLSPIQKFIFNHIDLLAIKILEETELKQPHKLWNLENQGCVLKIDVLEYDDITSLLASYITLKGDTSGNFQFYSYGDLENTLFEFPISDFAIKLKPESRPPNIASSTTLVCDFTDLYSFFYKDTFYHRINLNKTNNDNEFLWLKVTLAEISDIIKKIDI